MISEKIKPLAEPDRSPLQAKQLEFAEGASADWRTSAVRVTQAPPIGSPLCPRIQIYRTQLQSAIEKSEIFCVDAVKGSETKGSIEGTALAVLPAFLQTNA